MKKLAFIAIMAMFALVACEKDEESPWEDTNNPSKAKITIDNYNDNPYKVEFDGVYCFTLNGGGSNFKMLEKGDHSFKATQQSGYFIIPTVYINTISVTSSEPQTYYLD